MSNSVCKTRNWWLGLMALYCQACIFLIANILYFTLKTCSNVQSPCHVAMQRCQKHKSTCNLHAWDTDSISWLLTLCISLTPDGPRILTQTCQLPFEAEFYHVLWRSCCTLIILSKCAVHLVCVSPIPFWFVLVILYGPMATSLSSLLPHMSLSICICVIQWY